MSDEAQGAVEAEEVSQEVGIAPAQQEAEILTQEREQAQADQRRRNDLEYNWAEARRSMQERDRRIEELEKRLHTYEIAKQSPEEEEINLGDEDLPTYGNVKKVLKKDKKQLINEIRKEIRAEMAQSTLKFRFPDYDEIVTQENIEQLKKQKPELALSLANTPDPYAQAVAVYDAIKLIGGTSMPKNSIEKEKALKNAQKPLSVNAVTKQSAIGNAHLFENGLTPDLKKQLWNEMKQAAKQA